MPQKLSQGISKSFTLSYTRPMGFYIGATLLEMQRSAPVVDNALNGSRYRFGGIVGGGRMASARNYNVQFLLSGGIGLASQRFWIHQKGNDVELSSSGDA